MSKKEDTRADVEHKDEDELNERDPFDEKFAHIANLQEEEIIFEEFLAQVSFKRSTVIEGYSDIKIQFTFVPYKLTSIEQ
jgi:hypothetical protein